MRELIDEIRDLARPLWWERTRTLRPLHHEARPREPELETEPTGF